MSRVSLDEDELANAQMEAGVAASHTRSQRFQDGGGNSLSLESSQPKWLHMGVTRPVAEKMLLAAPAQGLFLFRAKKIASGQYALDVVNDDGGSFSVAHHAITRSVLGEFQVDGRPVDGGPRTLEALVEALSHRNHLLRHPLGDGLPFASAAGVPPAIEEEDMNC